MRYVYAVACTLLYPGGLRLLFAVAGVVFFVAGALDVFLFRNQALGLAAGLVGLVCLSCGYMVELWLGDVVTEVRAEETPRAAKTPEDPLHWGDQPFGLGRQSDPQPRSQGG